MKIIVKTLHLYTREAVEICRKNGIKLAENDFVQQYYDVICQLLREDVCITEEVYNEIPELHYWINKHFTIHGKNVVKAYAITDEIIDIQVS